MTIKPEKVNLVETPKTWDEIVSFCERASTPSDATVAALMAWNFCVDWHSTQDTCCEELRKIKERVETQTSKLDEPLLTQEERDALITEMNNDGC